MDIEEFQAEARTEEIRMAVFNRLSPKKYQHSINVARNAWLLAAKTTIDPRKMYIAGLLHDIANELSNDKILQLCERTDRYIPSNEMRHAHSLHGIAGACIAYEEFGIQDSEILMAIAFHSGRAGMQLSEKIIFLADIIDHENVYGMDPTRIWKADIDKALLIVCSDVIKYCLEYNLPMDDRMQDSFDYIIDSLRQKSSSEDSAYMQLRIEADDIVDRAMNIYLSHRLKIGSIKNIRDAGNYRTTTGKMIKKGKILRSADLSHMTPEDAKQLRNIGINTIIDLRNEDEIGDAKDQNIEDFRYFNCPLPNIGTKESSKRLLEYIKSSVSDEEKAWYATEFMRYESMKQLYRDVLISDDSIEQLRKIFDILLDENSEGVLIHCSNGKDRTGIVIMLIQFSLGMKEEEILNDYYASALPYYMITENAVLILEETGVSSEYLKKARELLSISANVISDLMSWWQENNYGTIDTYLNERLLISPQSAELLRQICLEL